MSRLEENRQLRDHLSDISPDGVERIADEPAVLERMTAEAPLRPGGPTADEVERARGAAHRLARGEELDEDEMFMVEAIVLPEGRPAIDIVGDSFRPPRDGLWIHLGDDEIKARIDAAIPAVGRVEVPDLPQIPFGGTAFVVSPTLLMTNRHVAELFARGLGRRDLAFLSGQSAGIDFKRERGSFATRNLRVRGVAMIHPYWDMALLRVDGLPADQPTLTLSIDDPRDLGAGDVVVIGYPAYDWRNDAELQRRIYSGVYNVKRLQPGQLGGRQTVRSFGHFVSAFKHNATTLGGCSGAAVVELATGHVVGLHFSGLYKVSNWGVPGSELGADPFVVDAGVRFAGASDGASYSWQGYWDEADPADEASAPQLTPAAPISLATAGTDDDGTATWTIPLEVSVRVGTPRRSGVEPAGAPRAGAPAAAPLVAEAEKPPTTPDPDYTNREGYDPGFLGDDAEVRVPWLTADQYQKVAFNLQATRQRHLLPYHHFSLVMNAERRVAYFTAVNIDGTKEVAVPRSDFRDDWSPDPRIEPGTFLDNDAYRDSGGVDNPLDRGHLVRRLDPCWGNDIGEVLGAHHDTFHWTNCSPQHGGFNRNGTTWGGVEEHILKNANTRDLRVSVFSGPVFRADDPIYRTPAGVRVQLPLDYWKIVVRVDEEGALSATAFMLSQSDLVSGLAEGVDVVFSDAFEQFQTTVRAVEEMTGLSFWQLTDHDPMEKLPGAEAAGAGPPKRRLDSFESILL